MKLISIFVCSLVVCIPPHMCRFVSRAYVARPLFYYTYLPIFLCGDQVSLRLEILTRKLPLKTPPVMTLYLFAPTENDANSNNSNSNSNGSKVGKQLQLVKKSDLDGGLSDDGRTKSSAAQDLLQRQVMNASDIYMQRKRYRETCACIEFIHVCRRHICARTYVHVHI